MFSEVEPVEKLILEHDVVFGEAHLIYRILDDEEKLILLEGFFQVVKGPELGRLDG